MTLEEFKKKELPDEPGVYFFKDTEGNILYIGKATSLRDRVRSYFSPGLFRARSERVADMVVLATDIEVTQTDSVLEALILEANLIKKHQPKYNTVDKDNRSHNYVVITDEDFPKVLVMRGRTLFSRPRVSEPQQNPSLAPFPSERAGPYELKNFAGAPHSPLKIKHTFGPFPFGAQLREAMKIIRRIFPYSDEKCVTLSGKPCFNRHIGLCPGVCTGEISKEEYAEQITNLKLFFEGKKKEILKNLEEQMKEHAKKEEFEKAAEARRKIFALTHIQDIALLKREHRLDESTGGGYGSNEQQSVFRIEAYDVAHSSGTSVVGAMVVVEDGEAKKSDYRKFRIRINPGVNDTGALKEMLRRRLGHLEWPLPDLIVVDGAQAQINVAEAVLKERGLDIEVVSVVKDARHKPKEILGNKIIAKRHSQAILLANTESHRFAVAYHRARRDRIV